MEVCPSTCVGGKGELGVGGKQVANRILVRQKPGPMRVVDMWASNAVHVLILRHVSRFPPSKAVQLPQV